MKTTILKINSKNMIVCDEPKCQECITRFTCKGACKQHEISFCENCKFHVHQGIILPTGEQLYCSKHSYWVMNDDVCKRYEWRGN